MPPDTVQLAASFCQAAPAALGLTPGEALERQLADVIQRARIGWPELDLDERGFVTHAAGRLIPDEGGLTQLAELHAPDLWLAYGCAIRHEPAIRAFDREVLGPIGALLARLQPTPLLVDEVRQQLREKLLVAAPGELPRIGDYAGRGSLTAWVRVAATRVALDLLRAAGARPHSDVEPDDLAPASESPELEYLKERYRPQFKAAFQAALESLDAEQRTILRMHIVEGLNIDEIGALFRVHRSTIARWIAAARVSILDEARRQLQRKLGLNAAEFESLAGVVRSQLSLSLSKILRRPP
jgi:RNA polymerase sigma-70 factor (ECF subfamily)